MHCMMYNANSYIQHNTQPEVIYTQHKAIHTRAHIISLPKGWWSQSTVSHSIQVSSILILPSQVCLHHSGFLNNILYIQGDSGGICTTLGNDSMSDSKRKSSYEHGSDFERLRSYGYFLIPVHTLMWTALTEPAGGCWLTVCIASITFASLLAHPATDSPVSVSRHLGNKGKVGWVFTWLQGDSNAAAGYTVWGVQ